MKKHFVTFYSPGTFVSEHTTESISSWDIKKAIKMASSIKERHGAVPYGFRFSTRIRSEKDLDSNVSKTSGIYYLPHCKILTLDQIKKKNDPRDSILISNMEINKWNKVVQTTKGWKSTFPLKNGDIVIKQKGPSHEA